jgi:deoxyribonuclease V
MWPETTDEMICAQRELAAVVPQPWQFPEAGPPVIGACVVVFPRGLVGAGARGDRAWAAAAALCGGELMVQSVVDCVAGAPYEPGLLALREGPCLEKAVLALMRTPDVLLVDGTGRDHPRRAGMALHLGAVCNLPTVGVTHRPLLASGDLPDDARGATSPLLLGGECVGMWLRTRAGARPLAVHPGWRTDIATAARVAMASLRRHRTPEPFRVARRLAREARALGRPREA